LKAIKAVPNEYRHHYQHRNDHAELPSNDVERSAFFKVRSLSILFKLRKVPRAELKAMCVAMKINYLDLVCDMPVRWNSTDKMVKAVLRMEPAIRAVLTAQQWDKSVRRWLTPTDEDWDTLKEMAIFFDIFSRPTVQSQAEDYPTLHNAIPNYLQIIRQLNVWQLQDEQPILETAAKAAHKVLTDYYKKSMETRHSFVATICDPRYKLRLFGYLYATEGGVNSGPYKKAKAHFQHVFSDYYKRAVRIKEYERQEAENIQPEARTPSPGQEEDDWRTNPFHGYDDYVDEQPIQQAIPALNSEVEQWLNQPVLPLDTPPDKIKAYMQSKAYEFPIITQIARDYLAIPATSAPSERVFSIAGNLISKKRTSIASENVRYVLCLRAWGLLAEYDDEVEVIIDEEGRIVDLMI
jgi:zinc finger BED domain-containing protein 1 (E3 SUMO-protein ligase ZBED1)